MRRIRPRSAYDVLALVSFFLVIGGGTALASFVVTSNSQVASNTISGHKPPSGDHANLISGSVNAQDLAPGAVTGPRLANASVSPPKLNLPSMIFSGPDTDPNDGTPHHTVLNLDGLHIGLSCVNNGSTILQLFVSSPFGGTIRGSYATGLATASPSITSILVTSTPTQFASATSSTGATYLAGEFTYSSGNRVIGMLVDGSANVFTDSCTMHGTAVPAPN